MGGIKGQILSASDFFWFLVPRCQESKLTPGRALGEQPGMWPIGFRASAAMKGGPFNEVLAFAGLRLLESGNA